MDPESPWKQATEADCKPWGLLPIIREGRQEGLTSWKSPRGCTGLRSPGLPQAWGSPGPGQW